MRIWTLHPKYLDSKGFVALWSETLLAQKVLQGQTKGWRNHPQLDRFKRQINPVAAVAAYLPVVYEESLKRCYNFDFTKMLPSDFDGQIAVPLEDVIIEWQTLKHKLQVRDPARLYDLSGIELPDLHPLFVVG